ncbi:hypothetical protein [Christiangramia aquimixticola]|uniref:hypothetical protein n=1 Tax=Christiangramia aquimixticola TaxID=1697558 RepID=UPI003AA82A4F
MKKHDFLLVFSLVLLLLAPGCSTDDDMPAETGEFFTANINGATFDSSESSTVLRFDRDYNTLGTVTLFVESLSATGQKIDFKIENYVGEGKYFIGDYKYNNNWITCQNSQKEGLWTIMPNTVLNESTNFIEITLVHDDYIEGNLHCEKLWGEVNRSYGLVNGSFRLYY